jgi:lipopolysaccharide/colanic/teichoic acid biosynthesis glycosyltransferase
MAPEALDQESFTKMVCLERKRADRSGRSFVLMLLECSDLGRDHRDGQECDRIMRILLHSTRETDIKGWYKEGSVPGVIFTEVGTADARSVTCALLRRVTTAVSGSITPGGIDHIHISFHVYPDDGAEQGRIQPPDLALYPDKRGNGYHKRTSEVLKRALDVFGSVAALLLLSPLFLAIAAAIRLTSRGPILFRQQRVGQYVRTFTFLKFRSMHVASDESLHRDYVQRLIARNAAAEGVEEDQRPTFKIRNDPRVTRVGRMLRRTSLDELPQFINVLRGEMSLVGPRPPIPYEYACYETWHRGRLLTVKPGITGLWQVRGRSRVNFDDMVRLDLKYAETWSIWLDLKILCLTPAAVLSGEGAY